MQEGESPGLPMWVRCITNLSHLLITFASSINFFIYYAKHGGGGSGICALLCPGRARRGAGGNGSGAGVGGASAAVGGGGGGGGAKGRRQMVPLAVTSYGGDRSPRWARLSSYTGVSARESYPTSALPHPPHMLLSSHFS